MEQKLAEARSKLAATEKKLDRLRCPTTAAVAVAVKDPGIKAEASSVDIKMEEDPNELSKFREQLTEMAALAEARLRAIQELEDEKKRLRDDLHDARYSHVSGNDDRSDRDAAYKDLYAHYMFVKKELEMVEDSRKKRDEEFNELRAGSVNFRKQIEAEEAQRRKPLEAEVRRLEADVNRLRAGRDQAQQLLEVRESKDKAEIIQNHEIRVIANTRKDRIDALEIENQRLRIKLAAIGGSREMVDVFNELAPEDAVSEIQSRYLKAQSQIEHLGRLAKSLGASERQLQDVGLK